MLYLVDETELTAGSIGNYVWALRAWFKYQRQLDPVYGVTEWEDFMLAVSVVAWMPSEPRREIPLHVVRAALDQVDLSSFVEVQAAVLILILLFTFARSETPCPRSFTGDKAFDPTQHLMVQDVEVRSHEGKPHVAVRLKAIKQDQRMERSADAATGEDWILVGEADGVFSLSAWLRRLFAFHGGARPRHSPFFLEPDRVRAYLYAHAMRDCRRLYARVVGETAAQQYGLHSLRVSGYENGKRGAVGEELAVAQGGWRSTAHRRYDRFTMTEVLGLPAQIVGQMGRRDPQPGRVPVPLAPASATPALALPGAPVAAPAVPTPRPVGRALPAAQGGRRGSARSASAASPRLVVSSSAVAPAAAAVSSSSVPLGPSARGRPEESNVLSTSLPPRHATSIEVYWTDERRWFAATVLRYNRDRTLVHVRYEPTVVGGTRWRASRYWHTLADEQWRVVATSPRALRSRGAAAAPD